MNAAQPYFLGFDAHLIGLTTHPAPGRLKSLRPIAHQAYGLVVAGLPEEQLQSSEFTCRLLSVKNVGEDISKK